MYGFIQELGKIEIEYDDNNFRSYIKSVETDYILIDFFFYKGSEYDIPDENWVAVKFKEKSGLYSGNCQILGKDNSRLPGIKISYPVDVKFIQQREYARAPLKLKMELLFFPENEEEGPKLFDISTLDVSGSGFSFASANPIEKSSKIIGIIYLSNPAQPPIEVLLQHVYSKKIIAAGKEVYKNAFTFNNLEEDLKEKILKEIFLYELELRKRGI